MMNLEHFSKITLEPKSTGAEATSLFPDDTKLFGTNEEEFCRGPPQLL